METRLKLDEARLAAMNAALPDFKAFYASLDEQQKRTLFPVRRGTRQHPMAPRSTGLNG
jgi:hypothetical protein